MNVRELPRKYAGLPILKATFLGWLGHQAPEPGYFCVVLTYGKSEPDGGDAFHVHLLRAKGLDKPWQGVEDHWNLRNGEAGAKFEQFEKLAEWPKGGK